jgi:hypothetical protein
MHPMERLRYVARAHGVEPSVLVRETAGALAAVAAEDPVGIVPGCRRLIERHVLDGPMWWLVARVLTASDPVAAAWAAADEIEHDPTSEYVARCLPDDATVTVVGWPPQAVEGLRRRGDAEVLVIESGGEGHALVRRLEGVGVSAVEVLETGLAAAVSVSDLVIIEALAAGPDYLAALAGSHAAAAVATCAGIPVWAVTGVGRVLPQRMWEALTARLDDRDDEPWDRNEEIVPARLVTAVVGPDGLVDTATGLGTASCPVVPELLRQAG